MFFSAMDGMLRAMSRAASRCPARHSSVNLAAASGPDVADEASVEAGIQLARWFGREALRVYEALAADETDRERETLAEWIAGQGGAVTPRELSRGPRAYRAEGIAEEALAGLVKAGFGRWEWDQPGDGGGRPGRRFRLG